MPVELISSNRQKRRWVFLALLFALPLFYSTQVLTASPQEATEITEKEIEVQSHGDAEKLEPVENSAVTTENSHLQTEISKPIGEAEHLEAAMTISTEVDTNLEINEGENAPENDLLDQPILEDDLAGQLSVEEKHESNHLEEASEEHGNKEEKPSQAERFQVPNFTGVTEVEKMGLMIRQATMATRLKDFTTAEKLYLKLLNMNLEDEDRRQLLLDMAGMYSEAGIISKTAVVYEKFLETYERDPELPSIIIKLGILYRDMGAIKLAISKFYTVLNVSLNIPQEKIDEYVRLSMKAQLEIAETYFQIGDYNEAAKFFSRLTLMKLSQKDQESVHFKTAYTQYLLENYTSVVPALINFIDNYPESHLVAEGHFLLANTYKRLNRPRDAVEETLNLLRKNLINKDDGEKIWFYWKKRTGNQLANEFFEQKDYLSSLKIYQAMAPQSSDPEWQWPIIYQIGLCFEHLRMYPKAREAYRILVDGEEWKDREIILTDNLKSIQEMAVWRIGHIDWQTKTESGLTSLLATSKPPNF